MFYFAVGFVVGAIVVACTFWPVVARWRKEYDAMADALDATHGKMRSSEKGKAVAQKHLEKANDEIERLRQEKLGAWGIPESY